MGIFRKFISGVNTLLIKAALLVLDVCDYLSIFLHSWLLTALKRFTPATTG